MIGRSCCDTGISRTVPVASPVRTTSRIKRAPLAEPGALFACKQKSHAEAELKRQMLVLDHAAFLSACATGVASCEACTSCKFLTHSRSLLRSEVTFGTRTISRARLAARRVRRRYTSSINGIPKTKKQRMPNKTHIARSFLKERERVAIKCGLMRVRQRPTGTALRRSIDLRRFLPSRPTVAAAPGSEHRLV